MTPMRLEDLRGPLVGDTALFLVPNSEAVPAAFHDHAQQAQWHTINCMVRLSGDRVDGVANERIAVVEWWRTVESLIALVHLVAQLESEGGMRVNQPRLKANTRDGVLDRWSAIARWFSASTDSAPTAITGRLSELRAFRNSFEHNSRQAAIDIRHSRLGAVPAHANLSDAIEAMAICVEVAAVLRHVLAELDLMPQCLVPSKAHVFYVPLDRLAAGLLVPEYRRVVRALGLETDIELYPWVRPLRGESLLRAAFAIKAHPGSSDVRLQEPLGLWPAFERFANAQPEVPSPDDFRLPDYVRRTS